MKVNRLKTFLISFLTISTIIIFFSCEIGLGAAVDTLVPEITIETPATGSIIRDNFKIGGNWSDDGSIGSVSIVLKDTETDKKYGSYNAIFETSKENSGKGTWSYIVEKGSVPDGTYETTITITDSVGHKTDIQRQVIIDNTSPVLVMQRPSSKLGATNKIESYGQIFTLDGQAADDNGVGLIEVNVYSDAELQNLLKTISFTNVPNTISLDVAKYIQDTVNDYSTIYGSTNINTAAPSQTRYCKIIAYDGSQRFPTDGSEQTEADRKGNPTTEYYLYDDISGDILSEYKVTDLYTMKKGRYASSDSSRAAAETALSKLDSHKIEANVFTLNPRNNPVFSIAGFSEMAPEGDFEAANMTVSNGDFLTIQVEPGLDGHLLVKESLRVKVKEIGVANSPYIYPSEQTISKDGDKYRIIAFMKKDDGLVSTHKYTVEVEGQDEQGNTLITQQGIGYGFFFRRSTVVPSVSVSIPNKEDEVVLNASNDNLTIAGTANFPADMCDGGKVIIKTTRGSETLRWEARDYTNTPTNNFTDQNLTWSYTIELKKDRTETQDSTGKKYLPDGQYQVEIFAEYYELEDDPAVDPVKTSTTILRSFNVDTQKPVFANYETTNAQITWVGSESSAYDPDSTTWYSSQNLEVGVSATDNTRDGYSTGLLKTEYQRLSSATAAPADNAWEQLSETNKGYLNGLVDGINYLIFRTTDEAGNVSVIPAAATSLKIDGYPPEIVKVWIGDGDTAVAGNWLELSTEKQMTVGGSHGETLRIEISENNDLHPTTPVTVNVTIGNGTPEPKPGTPTRDTASGNWIWTSTGIIADASLSSNTNSTIEISVSAKDEAGTPSVEKKYKYLIDTEAPVIQITQPAQDLSGEQSISSETTTLGAAINDANGTIKLSKYKLTSTPITGTTSTATDDATLNAISAAIIADLSSEGWVTSSDVGTVRSTLTINEGTAIRGSIPFANIEGTIKGTISEGHWYFYVYSIDDAGNAYAKKREFWTDRADPSLTVSDTARPREDGKYNLKTLGENNTLASITVSGTADDANGVTSVVYSRDGGNTWLPDLTAPGVPSTGIYNTTSKTWSFTETYGTSSSKTLNDGTYTFVIKATDTAGKQKLSQSFPVRIDCAAPTFGSASITSTAYNGWYRSQTVVPTVTVSDPNNTSTPGNIKVEYGFESFTNETPETSNILINKGNGECTGGVAFDSDGEKTIYLRATDEADNSSTSSITGIKIDTAAPSVQEKYYQISSGDISGNISSTIYVNGSDTLTIWGSYSDSGSGVEPLQTISISGQNIYNITDANNDVTVTYSTSTLPEAITSSTPLPTDFEDYADTNATSIKSWKAVIPNTKLQSGNITAGGKDLAGNSGYTQRPTITLIQDTEAPQVSNVSVAEPSTSDTRVYQVGETTTYYVNNSSGKTFTIKGVATDNVQVSSTVLTITGQGVVEGTTTTITKSYSSSDASNWTFTVNNLNLFTGTFATATITTTDLAGNQSTVAGNQGIQTLTLKFDTTAPDFIHQIDLSGKDLNFRIGEYANDGGQQDVGGKYQAGTYGTSKTIIVRGTTDEGATTVTESGLYRVWYTFYQTAPEGANPSFTKDQAKGYIDFSTEEKTVYYTDNDTASTGTQATDTVTSTFKGEIKGLKERSNYLLLLAEDNVGNTRMDSMTYTPADNVTLTDADADEIIAKWNANKKYYSLNVDTIAPELASTITGTQFSNGAANGNDITVTGTCYDTHYKDDGTPDGYGSDISVDPAKHALTLSVKIGDVTKTVDATITKTNAAGAAINPYTWTATIPASDLTGIAASTIPEGKTFNIDATLKDKAGLTTSSTVAVLQKDTQAPSASLISITPSSERTAGSSSVYYIRPTKDDVVVLGNTDDTYSTTVETYLKLVPYTITVTGDTAIETPDTDGTKYIGKNGVKANVADVTPTTERSWKRREGTESVPELTIPKETFTLSYAGAKLYACTKDLSGNEDTVELTKLVFDETGPAFNASYSVGGKTAASLAEAANLWHRNSNLSVKGTWADAAGVDKVYYKLLQTNYDVEATPPQITFDNSDNSWTLFIGSEGTNGNYNFENTIEGFQPGYNYVYMYAVDKLGNPVSQLSKLTIKVDSDAPTATDGYTDLDDQLYNFTNIYLTNGKVDKTLYYYVDEDPQNTGKVVSGIKRKTNAANEPDDVTVKLAGTTLAANKYTITLSDVTGSTTKKLVTVTLDKSILTGSGHRAVSVTLKDYAGNSVDTTIGTINMDTTAPVVRLNALKDADSTTAITEVNKTIIIKGTATDAYLKERPLTALEYKTDAADSEWTDLITDFTSANTNLVNAGDFSITLDTTDTTKFTDGTTYYVRAKVMDQAGNPGWSTGTRYDEDEDEWVPAVSGDTEYVEPLIFKVDQDTDRPIIKFTNLELPATTGTSEAKANLTHSTVTLKGSITDDDDLYKDDDGAYTNDAFQISLDGGANYSPITVNSGAWSFTFTSDGDKEVVFKVKDGAGTSFTAGAATTTATATTVARQTTPKLTDGTNWLGTHTTEAHTEFSLMVDTKLPLTQNMQFKLSEVEDAEWTSSLPLLGGPSTRVQNNKFLLRLVAADENGITSVQGKLDGTALTNAAAEETNYYPETIQSREVNCKHYQFETIDVSGLDGGSHSIELTITDGAGNEKKETITLSIDRDAPQVTMVSPTTNSLESASVWANGTISGARDQGLRYAISTHGDNAHKPADTLAAASVVTAWEEYNDSTNTSTPTSFTSTYKPVYSSEMNFGITWNIYFDNATTVTTDTHDKLLNQYLIDMGITTEAALSATDNTQFNKLVKLYLWLKAEDEVGNVVESSFPIILDPQGDRPTLSFTYPAEDGAMLGGKVTVYGTVEDTLGSNPGVASVWVQPISATHWKEDPNDSTQLIEDTSTGWGSFTANASNEITTFSLTTKDLDYLAALTYTENGQTKPYYQIYNMKTYKGDGTDVAWTVGSSVASGYTVNDYAVKANLSGTAWLLDINGNKEFNPTGADPSSVAMRLYARDNDGKFSIKFDRLVQFDANKPVISNLKLVQYGNETSYNITASQSYANNIFVKGEWWLTGTVTDGDKVGNLTINGTTLVETDDNGNINPVPDKAWWASGHETDLQSVEFRFKLSTGSEGSVGEQSVNIIAKDAAAGTPNEQNETYTVKYDNKPPVIAENADQGLSISSKVQQYNGFYKFSSKATEADVAGKKQSGFAYTAFYFKRAYGTTTKLYDVLQARSDAEHDISSLSPAAIGSAAANAAADNTLVTKDGLYWFVKTVSTNDTMSITMSDTSNVHKNSLVLIDGTYYLVDSVGTGTVTFTRNIPAGKTKAYVALAGIVNNSNEGHTDGAKPQWPGNGYYAASALNRDDGDGMVEDVSKLDTTWTWEANICSRNIPDGPVEIVYVVYDQAGNSVEDSVEGFVCNNQPRIAGVTIKTDYTGNNVAEFVVTDYSAAALSEDSVTGEIGTSPNTKEVYDPFANSLTKNDEHPLNQSMTAGTAANPLWVRGLTKIIPEIVGGNGAVYYSYSIENTTKTLADGTHPKLEGTGLDDNGNIITALYSETDANHTLNYDYTINDTAPINLQLGDLVYLGDTTTGIPFKFTFKDQTEGLSTLTPAQKTAQETEYGIKFEADLTVFLGINACQETWPTASIEPFFWNSLKENSIYDSENASSYKDLKGHIELEKDWTKIKTAATGNTSATYYSAYDGNTSGTYLDADPKVSGEIVLKGKAHDNKLLKKIEISINGVNREVASYDSDSGLLVSNFPYTAATEGAVEGAAYATNGINFIIDEQTQDSTGHSVEWTLVWNTQNTNFNFTTAKKDVEVKVVATNGGVPKREIDNTNGTLVSVDGHTKYLADQVEKVHSNTIETIDDTDTPLQTGSTTDTEGNVVNTAFYRMDVVPYVTDVVTSLSKANSGNPSVYSRTALGHYPVYMTHVQGNTPTAFEQGIKVYGFNLAGGKLYFDEGTSGSNSVNLTAATGYYTIQIPTGAKTGKATVSVGTGANAVESLNNRNNDDSNGSSGRTVSSRTGDADIYGTYFYNRQPNEENNNRLTDDLYFDVWDFNTQAAVSQDNSCLDIMMKINPSNGLIGFAFSDGATRWSMANNSTSYTGWARTPDFIQLTGFGYDSYGYSYGTAAGGESSAEDVADSFDVFSSRWGVFGNDTYMNTAGNAYRIECTGQETNGAGQNLYTLNKKRFQNPSFATHKGTGTNNPTDLYLAYYDATNAEIRFRAGTTSGTGINNRATFGSFVDRYTERKSNGTKPKPYNYNTSDFQILANGSGANLGTAGEFLSLGVTSDNVVVIIWYDGTELKLSYNTNPLPKDQNNNIVLPTGTARGGWQDAVSISSGASKYCQLVVDAADNIHVAAYDNANGDLKYIYIPMKTVNNKHVPDTGSRKECIVDSYLSVGKELTIDVAGEIIDGTVRYIPHIGYFGSTPKKPRYAYLADPTAFFAASDANGRSGTNDDMYTGIWECGVVPSGRTITLDEKRRINVGVWKADVTHTDSETNTSTVVKGERVASNHTGFSTGTSSAASGSGTCYGNGTQNAVLAYGVQYSKMRDYVETAQMR